MPVFSWSCVIPTKFRQSLEIRVRGLAQVEDADAIPILKARGLFGPVKVAFKIIPADGTGFLAVNTYREFLQIHGYIRSYEKHLNDAIDRYRQHASDRTAFDVIGAYKKIKDDLLPVSWILYSIDKGSNMSGGTVWLENEVGNVVSMVAVPPRTATPRTPTPSPSPPPPTIPPRLSSLRPEPPSAIPSAPPQEFLYPELPSHVLYPELPRHVLDSPPSYAAVMWQQNLPALPERSKVCTLL